MITYGASFWYSLNPRTIEEFNFKVGNEYIERYILPNLYSTMRNTFIQHDSLNIKLVEIEKEIKSKLELDVEFKEFIQINYIQLGEIKKNKNFKVTKTL